MAVKDCNELSNIIAIWVAAGDDDLAQEISRLSLRKRDALARSWNLKEGEDAADTLTWRTAHELELKAASADIELRAIVQAKILNWDIRVWEAYMELANQIRLTWGTIAWWVDLLEKVRNAAPADYEKIAKLWWGWYSDWATAMKEIQESISEFVSSNYSISEYSRFTNDKAAQLRKQLVKWELTQEKYDEEVLKLHKEAMDAIAKWENPSGFVKLDKEWQTIKKVFWKDPEKAGRMRSQFIMARELLTDGWLDDDMLKAFSSFKADKLTWDLTLDQIAKCDDLDKLLARAYTNTEQIYTDWVLRQAYREKLINLSSGKKINKENIEKINSLSKTLRFTEQWASFSDVLVRDKIYRSAKKRWLDVSKTDWTKLYNGLLNFSKEMEINPDAIKETIEIAWVEMKPIDVVQLLYDVTWDDNILQLIKIWSFDDKTILDVATRAMLWENKVAAEKIIKLFTKAKETPNITNARDLALKTITWENIKEGASVGFFDYKRWLYNKDDLNRMRADFMDKLAEKNKMKINGGEIKELTTTEWSAEDLAKVLKEQIWWWYLIVNDVKRKDNDLLREALDIANSWVKEEDKIIVINPHRAMDANFTFEGGDLYFRTMDDLLYKDVAWTISIQSLWEARPTREIEATLYEATTWRNWDKIRYQASYIKWWVDNVGRNLSDQQVDFFAPSKMRDQNWNMVRAYRWRNDALPSQALGKNPHQWYAKYWDQTVLFFTTSKDMARVYWTWRSFTWKRIRNLEDAVAEINARAMNEEFFEVSQIWDNRYTITMKADYLWRRQWETIFDWDINALDRFLIDEENEVTMFSEPRLYEAYLYAENPLEVDAKWKNRQSVEFNGTTMTTDDIALYAAQNWYDWVIIRNVEERSWIGVIDDYIVFDQSQVKGVDNLVPTTDVNWRYELEWRHWSPYSFEEFNREFAKSWEGAEAHWAGIYIAAKKWTGERYAWYGWDRQGYWWWMSKERLEDSLEDTEDFIEGIYDDLYITRNMAVNILDDMTQYPDPMTFKEAIEYELGWVNWYLSAHPDDVIYNKRLIALNNFLEEDFILWEPTQHLYQVQIPDRKVANTPTWHNYLEEDWIFSDNIVMEILRAARKEDWFDYKRALSNIRRNDEAWMRKMKSWYQIYQSIEQWFNNDSKRASRFFEDLGYDGIHYFWETDWECWVIFNSKNAKIKNHTSWETYWHASWENVSPADALKVKMFKSQRTVKEIADRYWVDIKLVESIVTPEGAAAYWAYWNGMIMLSDMIKESTAPHELFHAMFDVVDKDVYDKILADWTKLFGLDSVELEEMLADEFSKWFRTWKFTYWDAYKKLAKKKSLNTKEKSFVKLVEKFFNTIKEWLWLVDNHKAEVKQLFSDMVNFKYLPDAWNLVNTAEALAKYNNELNATAMKYFWDMLWVSWEVTDKEYVDRVQTLLSERVWMDIKAFDQIQDKSALWKKIDKQFALDRLTAWKYDKVLVDVNWLKRQIEWLSNEELAREIRKNVWDMVQESSIVNNENIEHIREAYLDYMSSASAIDNLTAKWKIISLANGWEAQEMTIDEIKSMFKNRTFEQVYKQMFFPNQDVSPKDMKRFINSINSDMFDTLSIWFAENLVDAWYALPLVNIKDLVYDFLNDSLDLNSKFVEAFFYKNNIPFTAEWLNTLINTLMPKWFKFDYEDALFKWRFAAEETTQQASVFRQVDNRFLQDSYSALASIQMARAADVPINYEEEFLTNILDKYVNEIYEWVKKWTLTFRDAQWIKQEASYALDMFEQDFLIPRYGKFLSQQEKQWLMWMKYSLPIWVGWQNPDVVNNELRQVRNNLLQKYKATLWWAAQNNDINVAIAKWIEVDDKHMAEQIDKRRQQLMDSGWVIREVNWQYIVYDVKEALEDTINSLPDTIRWLEWIRWLWKEWINQLSNKQAYTMLRYLEAAKWLNTSANYVTELMYKQNPMLQKYMFFDAFRVEDWLPRALHWNALLTNNLLNSLDNTAILDKWIKQDIFSWIIKTFRDKWHINMDELSDIVKKSVSDQVSNLKKIKLSPKEISEVMDNMNVVYQNAFTPYTYLRDIPKWGTLLDWTQLPNMKQRVQEVIKQQYNQAIADLKAAWIDDLRELQDNIYIRLNDWTEISLSQAADMDIDSWKKSIFNDESVFVSWADEMKIYSFWDETDQVKKDDIIRQEKRYREDIINWYNSTLQAMLNQTQVITEAEKNLMTAFMNDVRTAMRRYTLTNQMADALDAVSWLNEEAARWIKDYLIWWKGTLTFGKYKPNQIIERYDLVKNAYQNYYNMDLAKIQWITPTTRAEDLALKLVKYFKNLERLLWSADWLTWCTTRADINRAFYHLWETFMNLEWVKWIFWMLSAIEQNQVLKFFKFSRSWQPSYVKEFVRRWTWGFQESLWWYRDYAETISWITASEFNAIFWSAFDEADFKRILQWLTGFSLVWDWWWRTASKILNILNGSNVFFRFMMSYPWQLLTIPQQWTAYFLKQIWLERRLWIESLSDIEKVRAKYWILDWVYNEINIWWKSSVSPDDLNLDSFYNRYWIPDVNWLYEKNIFETSDDYINMYAKIDNTAASSENEMWKWFRQLDPYKDNANNIIDALFSRNFKDISFAKALKENDYMQFTSAQAFREFMDDPTVSAAIKTRAMDRVTTYAWRNMRNILWLGFWWLDRPVAWSWFGNIMYSLMQLFNFRWAWWQNIFKQAWASLWTMFKMLFSSDSVRSREWREAISKYIATQPEFLNFTSAVFNDIKWTWKLQRFQDNGRFPDEDDMYWILDFLEYFRETMNMTSQVYQGLQSFWPFRPIDEWAWSMLATALDPTVYKDTYWIWAFFNALGKNFWRQRKPVNWLTKLAWALSTYGPDWAWAYIENEFWKLSFGSLRYMTSEDENAYWYTYELVWQTWWIPSILMWEAPLWSDKTFMYELDNSETWETMSQIFDSDLPWDTRKTYMWNLWKTFINWSQLASLPKNVRKVINQNAASPYTADDLADTIQSTAAWREFYEKWFVTPSNWTEAKTFFDTILKNAQYRPGSSNFNKSLMQFETYWHMNGNKEKWNAADEEMELWLQHMKYQTNGHWEFVKEWWERVVDPGWTRLIQEVQWHYYNQTYVTDLIYAYSKAWLNEHSSDPNYNLYIKMLWQWHAHNLVESQLDNVIKYLNASAGKSADSKWSETELKNSQLYLNMLYNLGNSTLEWDNMSFFDRLQRLDLDNSTVAALQIIKDQASLWDRKTLDKFFTVTENDDWSKSVDLRYQYKSMLTQLWSISRAFSEWNVERWIAEASSLVHMFSNEDPTWAVTATMIDSIYHRLYDVNTLSAEQKQEAMIALFHDNKEFIQRNPEVLRKILWDAYDTYADYMNKMLYQRDGQLISNLESIQSSWKGSSWTSSAARKLSSAFKKLANSIWWDNYSWYQHWSTNSYKQWVPIKVSWANLAKDLWLKWYSPSYTTIGQNIKSYKPHVDFSINKDVNRKIKTTKTQAISSKKQLSKIEEKVEKALEAED